MGDNETLLLIVFMVCTTVITITFIMFGRGDDGNN